MSRRELEQKFPALKSCLAQSGMLWISWPKGSSGVATDLNENVVREIGLSKWISGRESLRGRRNLVGTEVCLPGQGPHVAFLKPSSLSNCSMTR